MRMWDSNNQTVLVGETFSHLNQEVIGHDINQFKEQPKQVKLFGYSFPTKVAKEKYSRRNGWSEFNLQLSLNYFKNSYFSMLLISFISQDLTC